MTGPFSTRTAWDLRESAFAASLREARAAGRELVDLTVSNPTRCGFDYEAEPILAALRDPAALVYDPDPRGLLSAREAVGAYYAGHRAAVSADRLILTTSTSEAYAYLVRLLCNAGDELLVAQPSYPLFDYLADLEDVRLRPYPLFWDYGWWIDFTALEAVISPRARAILLVHPNNPTGHATRRAERDRLHRLCAERGLALIVDEVFLDYPLDPSESARLETFAAGPHPVLTFVVSGLSKVAGLPQMKAAWIAAFGPHALQREALARLEIVADTFLSMNAPVQLALPAWLQNRRAIQRQILDRVRGNLALASAQRSIDVLGVEAGWCAVLRLPETSSGEEAALRLVREAGVAAHPGSFYGMAERNRVVVSLLPPPEEMKAGLDRVVAGGESNGLTPRGGGSSRI